MRLSLTASLFLSPSKHGEPGSISGIGKKLKQRLDMLLHRDLKSSWTQLFVWGCVDKKKWKESQKADSSLSCTMIIHQWVILVRHIHNHYCEHSHCRLTLTQSHRQHSAAAAENIVIIFYLPPEKQTRLSIASVCANLSVVGLRETVRL